MLVDWQQVDPVYRDGLTALLTDLARALHEERRELWLSIPVGNDIAAFDLDALASVVDRFVALLYDENGENDSPGPVASLPWWNEWLEVLLEHGDRRQWVVGIGNYGYDWPAGGVALIPVVDVMLVLSLIWGAGGALVGYAVFFFALEWALALLGCHLEREPLRTSLRIFPMRLVYRPLLCYAVWASIIRALRGAWYGWGKQERKGLVIPVFESIQETRKKAA